MASKYTYKTKKAKRCNYGGRRNIKKLLYAVVHYTGNDCDTDEGNANHFANNNVGASAHYFIDDDSVTQSVPDEYVAWSVGSTGLLDQGSPYREKGAKYWGKCTNTNSLNFELCDTVKDGKRKLSKKTRANAVVFVAKKMHEYDIPISRLIRHFDVNGKLCPIYWVTDEEDWLAFKDEVNAELKKLKGEKETVKKPKGKYSGTLPTMPKRGYLKKGDTGTQVGRLQSFLNWYGDYGLAVDEDYGSLTESAVEDFQAAEGLTADGKFGKKSLAKAESLSKPATKKTYSGKLPTLPLRGYLRVGDTGTQVGRLQEFLNWYGNYGLKVDKDFGPLTEIAVEDFQKNEGLVVDGDFGKKSLAKAKTVKK